MSVYCKRRGQSVDLQRIFNLLVMFWFCRIRHPLITPYKFIVQMQWKQTLLYLWSTIAKRTEPPPEEQIMHLEASESMPVACPSASTTLSPAGERNRSFDAVCRIETKLHPGTWFKLPKTDSRSYQSSWFLTFQWLHYDEKQDCVFCFDCARAFEMKGSLSMVSSRLS